MFRMSLDVSIHTLKYLEATGPYVCVGAKAEILGDASFGCQLLAVIKFLMSILLKYIKTRLKHARHFVDFIEHFHSQTLIQLDRFFS